MTADRGRPSVARAERALVAQVSVLSRRQRWAAVSPIVLLGAASLWWPDNWDNALFIAGARQLSRGGIYYRDLWDIKQPGIYWFHQLGGLIDPGGMGARLLEAGLAVLAARLVLTVIASWSVRRWIRILAPSLVVAPSLWWSFRGGIGQVETLLVVTWLVILAATVKGGPDGRAAVPSWFLAGVATGWVAVLKALYLPLPLIVMGAALIEVGRRGRNGPTRSSSAVIGRAVAGMAGVLLPIGLFLGFVGRHGLLPLAWWTSVTLPPQVAGTIRFHTPGERVELLRSVLVLFALTGPLAVIAVVTARHRIAIRERALAVMAVLGFAMTVPQLWTPYRYLMFTVPVGLLAVAGLEVAVTWWLARSWRRRAFDRVVVGVASVLALLPAQPAAALVVTAPSHPWGLDRLSRVSRGSVGYYGDPMAAVAEAAPMTARIAPDEAVYVLGDPTVMQILGARPGIEVMGWSLDLMPPRVFEEAARELARSRPRWVFVHAIYRSDGAAAAVGAPFQPVLRQYYRVIVADERGTWYRTDAVGPTAPDAEGVHLP